MLKQRDEISETMNNARRKFKVNRVKKKTLYHLYLSNVNCSVRILELC